MKHDAEDDADEADEAHNWSDLNTNGRKDIFVEGRFGASAAGHQNKADDNDGHRDGKDDVVDFVECHVAEALVLVVYL